MLYVQQTITVTRTVTDKTEGSPFIGVVVQVKGSSKGTVTDENGRKIPGLSVINAGYVDSRINQQKRYAEQYHLDGSQQNRTSSLSKNVNDAIIAQTENYLTYENTFNNGYHLKVMGGITTSYSGNEGFSASRDTIGDYPRVDERYQMLSWGAHSTMENGDSKIESSQVSIISRLNYDFQSKYILSATFRADASSKFSPLQNFKDAYNQPITIRMQKQRKLLIISELWNDYFSKRRFSH